jgi:hypothetical protein
MTSTMTIMIELSHSPSNFRKEELFLCCSNHCRLREDVSFDGAGNAIDLTLLSLMLSPSSESVFEWPNDAGAETN